MCLQSLRLDKMEARKSATVGVPVTSRLQPDQRAPPTQLQFSWNAPASSENPPARLADPRPIIIEKLKPAEGSQPRDHRAGDGLDLQGSVEFSVVSQEKLDWAVQLAKRDVRRRHLEEQVHQHLFGKGEGPAPCPQGKESGSASRLRASRPRSKHEGPPGNACKAERTSSRAKVYLRMPTQGEAQQPPLSDSPPTHDPGLTPVSVLKRETDRSVLEVRRLQKELQAYIQKVEELARKERSEMTLDPEEEHRVRVRRQEQAVRSARTLYVLQQQVKEIQDDLEKLSPHKIKHTKKSRAMARLAAAHRGAVRALQTFVTHFADQHPLPPSTAHFRQLGHLLRQLSLCSARLEMDDSIPDVIVDLLLQIEDLDVLLARRGSPKQRPGVPPLSHGDPLKGPSRLPQREKAAVVASESQKPTAARKLLPDEPPKSEEILHQHEPSGAGGGTRPPEGLPPSQAEAVGQQGAGETSGPRKAATGPSHDHGPSRRKGGVLFSTRPQGSERPPRTKGAHPLAKQARFREPTVSFRMKETKPPVRECRTPWVPPSLASPLSSPQRHPERTPKSKEPSPERGAAAEGKQGTPRKEMVRAEGSSPTQIAKKIEQAVRERLEPLLARVQKANLSLEGSVGRREPSGDRLPRPLDRGKTVVAERGDLEGGPEASAGEQLWMMDPESLLAPGAPDLEAMLQRMEEMERFQEAVRRRYHQIVYSDTEFGAQEARREKRWGAEESNPGAGGIPPSPIQITRLASHREVQVDIVLERPWDANAVQEEDFPEPPGHGAEHPSAQHLPPQRNGGDGGVFCSVPVSTLQSIRDYGARYEQHLKRISHAPVGTFDPWHITQSLAEELMEEALAEVATELQDLCEDYAEAVFTSEFLQAPE
ncbi:protein moonraker [Pogona vitticeps]